MLRAWVIRKDPERLGSKENIREECFVYLVLILGNPAWFWCNRSRVIIYVL